MLSAAPGISRDVERSGHSIWTRRLALPVMPYDVLLPLHPIEISRTLHARMHIPARRNHVELERVYVIESATTHHQSSHIDLDSMT